MDGDSFGTLFDVLMWAGCAYCLYSWYWMRTNGKIHSNPILIPSRLDIDDCKDSRGYITYISPRLFIFGIAGTCLGGLNWYGNYGSFPRGVSLTVLALMFINIVWFALVTRGALKTYWNTETIPRS